MTGQDRNYTQTMDKEVIPTTMIFIRDSVTEENVVGPSFVSDREITPSCLIPTKYPRSGGQFFCFVSGESWNLISDQRRQTKFLRVS